MCALTCIHVLAQYMWTKCYHASISTLQWCSGKIKTISRILKSNIQYLTYIVENSNLFELKKLLVINNINELNEDSEHILDKILILCKTNDFKPKISEINSKKINIDHQLDFKPKTKLKKLSTPSPQYFACLNYSTNIADKNLLWCPSSVIYLALNSKVL